jgi:leucyl-tRNA synthetase
LFHTNGKFHVNDEKPNDQILKSYHKVVKKVNSDIENFSFNTSVSAFMICINELSSLGCKSKDILSNLCILLSPFAPHICEELWSLLGNKNSISYEKFPMHDEKYLIESMIEYPVSFNGKLRFKINLSASLKQNEVEDIIKNHQSTDKYLNGNSIKKIIFVPKKIINVVC